MDGTATSFIITETMTIRERRTVTVKSTLDRLKPAHHHHHQQQWWQWQQQQQHQHQQPLMVTSAACTSCGYTFRPASPPPLPPPVGAAGHTDAKTTARYQHQQHSQGGGGRQLSRAKRAVGRCGERIWSTSVWGFVYGVMLTVAHSLQREVLRCHCLM